jgi:hypothetical protein
MAYDGLDLRSMPGPGGVKMLTALAEGNTGRDWCTWLIAAALPLTDGAILPASRIVMEGGALAAVLGATLAGHALSGWRAGLCAGGLAATWSWLVFTSVTLGADAPACGLAWLGVGLCWMAGRSGLVGLPVSLLGAGLVAFAAAVKIVALPAAALLAIGPMLARKWWHGLLHAAAAAAGLLWGRERWLASSESHVSGMPTPDLAVILEGLSQVEALLGSTIREDILLQLLVLGAVGALLPGRRWLPRLLLAGLTVGVFGFTAQTISDKLRPRYLVPASLSPIVLSGVVLALLPTLCAPIRRLRLLRPLAWVPLVGVCGGLSLDALGLLHGWSSLVGRFDDTRPAVLAEPPQGWMFRYHRLPRIMLTDHTAVGAAALVELARSAPAGGAAVIPLRDAREFHLTAAAALAEHPYTVLESRRCCQGADTGCAAQTVAALDAAGARLILPTTAGADNRVPHQHKAFARAIQTAAESIRPMEEAGPWWQVWQGAGSSGTLPCLQKRGR